MTVGLYGDRRTVDAARLRGVLVSTLLPADVVYTDVVQTFTSAHTFNSSTFKVRNPGDTFSYTFVAGAISANRNLTLPTLTADDTVAVLTLAQTFIGRKTFNGSLVFNSGVQGKRTDTGDANYTILATDFLVVCNNSAPRTLTLPTATTGTFYIIKDEMGNAAAQNITVVGTGGETIDGAASKVINANYGALRLYGVSGGSGWFTI